MSQRKVFTGKLFDVYVTRKELPNGHTGYWESIDHPGASAIVPFCGGRILLIRQYRAVVGEYIWEIPAGVLEPGETPYQCAKREIIEETGYSAKKLVPVGKIYPAAGCSNEVIHIFKAECGKRGNDNREAGEIIKLRHFTAKEVKALVRNGKIYDAKTLSAFALLGIA
ncbi:MAG: NUDIX hydrolase [Candidatus Omnitrophica bacterium]|nr:NUDIX hydrolase [Candidatus Omnitrophota bacterium]